MTFIDYLVEVRVDLIISSGFMGTPDGGIL
jgi:hypothetical protein